MNLPCSVRPWRGLLCLACLLLAARASCAAAELRLVFDRAEERITTMQPVDPKNPAKPPSASAPAPAPRTERESGRLTVHVGEIYFLEESEAGSILYDFASRRILSRGPKDPAWTGISLYSELGFQIMEYQNRKMLGGALTAAGLKDPAMAAMGDTFELETLFSLRLPADRQKPVPDLKRGTQADGAWVYRRKDAETVAFKPSTSRVPETLRPGYERWLVYRSRIHPSIRSEIVATGLVPALLRTQWHNTGQTGTTTLGLKSVELVATGVHAPAPGAEYDSPAQGELRDRVAAARDPKRGAQRPTLAQAEAYADKAIAAGHALDGLLALIEITLQDGADVAPAMRARMAAFQGDALCKSFFSSLDLPSKEACERSLKALAAIDRTGLAKDYILDIHIGDDLADLGRDAEAEKAFLAVLKRNPCIAGVWKDLGDVCFRQYEMPKAWICWDTARRLSPSHPMLKDIGKYEARLERDFPEYFLPR